jgi:hypothetical protein
MDTVDHNKWVAVHYLPNSFELTNQKGAQISRHTIPSGFHILQIAADVLITLSSHTLNVQQKLQMTSKGYFFQYGPTSLAADTMRSLLPGLIHNMTPAKPSPIQ